MTTRIEADKLRFVAGAFATGIGIATVLDDTLKPVGMTINSFLSVSLDPPLVLFSAANDSRIVSCVEQGTEISINILSKDQKHLSDHFAAPLKSGLDPTLLTEGRYAILPDAAAWYMLEVNKLIPAGDHQLVLCQVIDCWRDDTKEPIVFYNGYRNIGQSIN